MRILTVIALLGSLCALCAARAETDVDPAVIEAAQPLAGVYLFTRKPEDGVTCVLYLEGKPDMSVMRAWVAAGCETQLFWMSDFSGWMPLDAGGIQLFGAELTPLADFAVGKDGVLTSVIVNDGKTYTLIRAPWVKD